MYRLQALETDTSIILPLSGEMFQVIGKESNFLYGTASCMLEALAMQTSVEAAIKRVANRTFRVLIDSDQEPVSVRLEYQCFRLTVKRYPSEMSASLDRQLMEIGAICFNDGPNCRITYCFFNEARLQKGVAFLESCGWTKLTK